MPLYVKNLRETKICSRREIQAEMIQDKAEALTCTPQFLLKWLEYVLLFVDSLNNGHHH